MLNKNKILDDLRLKETILAGNFQENFKFHKDLAQILGAMHPRVIRLGVAVSEIQTEWFNLKQKIKDFE